MPRLRRPVASLGICMGLAALLLPAGVAAGSPDDLLPDLRMARPSEIRLDTDGDGRRLLRFSALIVNTGQRPLVVRGKRDWVCPWAGATITAGPFPVSGSTRAASGTGATCSARRPTHRLIGRRPMPPTTSPGQRSGCWTTARRPTRWRCCVPDARPAPADRPRGRQAAATPAGRRRRKKAPPSPEPDPLPRSALVAGMGPVPDLEAPEIAARRIPSYLDSQHGRAGRPLTERLLERIE